jgi:hypothetical protein
MKHDEIETAATEMDSTATSVGDVETAGETTAADTITGPANPQPVGADTLVKVADEPAPPEK